MTRTDLALPAGAIDNHCHVLDPSRPAVAGARYPLFDAPLSSYRAHLESLGATRGVLVTASAHGTDNEPMLAALATAGGALRGIAVVEPDVTDAELIRLHEAGVRGIRVQDRFAGGAALGDLPRLAPRLAELGWHIEIWTRWTEHLDWLPDVLAASPVPAVIDHLGYFPVEDPAAEDGLAAMIRLAAEERIWITVSGASRLTPGRDPSESGKVVATRVARLLATVPHRLLWGSDWPHVASPVRPPSAEELLAQLSLWTDGDEDLIRRLTVTNNEAAYGFLA